MSGLVVFLQNAWSPLYAGGTWPRRSWLHALARSRSGQRLKLLIDDFDVCENTTPIVGDCPDSVVAPDEKHIKTILTTRQPRIVVACGKQAELVLTKLWAGALLAVPHPAHRLLTDGLYREARGVLTSEASTRLALRQAKGSVAHALLPCFCGQPIDPIELAQREYAHTSHLCHDCFERKVEKQMGA